jgi:hypothetical protein
MFEPTSRYYRLAQARYQSPDGRQIAYVTRRILPQGEKMPLLIRATVQHGDRLDLITARTLGDPEQFWQVADANNAMNPFSLPAPVGRVLRVPRPQVKGQ